MLWLQKQGAAVLLSVQAVIVITAVTDGHTILPLYLSKWASQFAYKQITLHLTVEWGFMPGLIAQFPVFWESVFSGWSWSCDMHFHKS